jgi:hypothetical protein
VTVDLTAKQRLARANGDIADADLGEASAETAAAVTDDTAATQATTATSEASEPRL